MAHRIGKEAGLRHVYTGNVHDRTTQSTWCHECGGLLVGRDWYQLDAWELTVDGRCRKCGTPCPGVLESRPGTWGARREVVRIGRHTAR
jgi:pyruvate formate lyase activating enzyme